MSEKGRIIREGPLETPIVPDDVTLEKETIPQATVSEEPGGEEAEATEERTAEKGIPRY